MISSSRAVFFSAALGGSACVVAALDVSGKGCPCPDGFFCDQRTNRCVDAPPIGADGGDSGAPPLNPADAGDGSVADSYGESVRSDEPMAYFRFEDTSGTSCKNEISPSAIACTYPPSAVTYGAVGASGRCVRFDDVTATIALSGPTDFPNDVPFTIEFWVNFDQAALPTGIFAQMKDPDAAMGQRTGTWLPLNTKGEPFTETWSAGVQYMNTYKPGTLPTRKFVHVALTHSGKDHLYVNGAVGEGNILAPGLKRLPTGVPMFLGSFIGCVDELAFYDRALPATRIASHVAAGPTQ